MSSSFRDTPIDEIERHALELKATVMSAVALSPFSQRLKHGSQTLSLFGEVVLNSGRMVAVKSPADEAMFFHSFQAGG